MFHFIRKILKDNITSIDMEKFPNSIVLSFTDDGSMYVNRNDGSQQKITDVIVVDSKLELEELNNYGKGKLYVINSKEEKSIMIKTDDGLIDIFKDIKDKLNTSDMSLIEINNSITEIAKTMTDLDNKTKTNASHILNAIDAINNLRKDGAKKEFKVVVPLSNLKVGLIEPIIPVSSFIFNEKQKVVLEAVSYNNVAGTIDDNMKLNISISLFDKNNTIVKKIGEIIDPKHVTDSIIISDENKVEVVDGFYRLNVESIENIDTDYRGTIVIKISRSEDIEDITIPTGPLPEK